MHSKRLNFIVYDIQQTGVWEEREVSLYLVRNFLKTILKVENAENIVIVDVHRLHRRNRDGNYSSKSLPLIFKVQTMADKKSIADNLRNLTPFNIDKLKKKEFLLNLIICHKKILAYKKRYLTISNRQDLRK